MSDLLVAKKFHCTSGYRSAVRFIDPSSDSSPEWLPWLQFALLGTDLQSDSLILVLIHHLNVTMVTVVSR